MPVGIPIPTAGYPSRTAAMLALADEGLSEAEIALRLGVAPHRVRYVISGAYARQRDRRAFALPAPTYGLYRRAAERRGLTAPELIQEILEVVARDGMVDAILDDDAAAA